MLALGFTSKPDRLPAHPARRTERHPGLKLLIAMPRHAALSRRPPRSCVKNDISKDFGLPIRPATICASAGTI
jgi:hypothetical protein